MRVSIGMPVYNAERFLAEAIDSVLGQELTDLELIICDNASTDRTATIAREYAAKDRRVSLYQAATNQGAGPNYNRSFEVARGTYFKWAAGDDVLAPTFLSRCVEVLEEEPKASIAYPRVVDIDAEGNVIKHWGPIPGSTSDRVVDRFSAVVADPGRLREWPIFGLIRSSALRATKLIRPFTGSDFVLLAELAVAGYLVEVEEELFLHREHDGRSTRAYAKRQDRAAWFDASRTNRPSFPYWAQLGGFARAPWQEQVPMTERARCVASTFRWGRRNWRKLRRDLQLGIGDGSGEVARRVQGTLRGAGRRP